MSINADTNVGCLMATPKRENVEALMKENVHLKAQLETGVYRRQPPRVGTDRVVGEHLFLKPSVHGVLWKKAARPFKIQTITIVGCAGGQSCWRAILSSVRRVGRMNSTPPCV